MSYNIVNVTANSHGIVEELLVPRMDPEKKEVLVTALRSGNYLQGAEALTKIELDSLIEYDCCLGVACKLAEAPSKIRQDKRVYSYHPEYRLYDWESSYLPQELADSWGFDGRNPTLPFIFRNEAEVANKHFQASLAGCNDGGCSFDQIADVIQYFY